MPLTVVGDAVCHNQVDMLEEHLCGAVVVLTEVLQSARKITSCKDVVCAYFRSVIATKVRGVCEV